MSDSAREACSNDFSFSQKSDVLTCSVLCLIQHPFRKQIKVSIQTTFVFTELTLEERAQVFETSRSNSSHHCAGKADHHYFFLLPQ
jgi:hypothetical protein